MTKATYDEQVDSLWIRWNEQPIDESDEVSPGVILDYDTNGNVVGVEVLNASKKIEQASGPLFRDLPKKQHTST